MSVLYRSSILCLSVSFCCLGCSPPAETAKGTSKSGVIGQKTQNIGEFDPEAKQEVSGGGMKPTSPLNPLGALNAYQPAIESLSKLQIKQAVEMFRATNGRYPESHDEFMSEIIKPGKPDQIRLPKLPGEWKYQYDVENHELVVVRAAEKQGD